MENKQWFLSSTGSGDLALRVKGLLVALIPLITALLRNKSVNIDQGELVNLINIFFEVVEKVGFAISGLMLLWGQIRALKINK